MDATRVLPVKNTIRSKGFKSGRFRYIFSFSKLPFAVNDVNNSTATSISIGSDMAKVAIAVSLLRSPNIAVRRSEFSIVDFGPRINGSKQQRPPKTVNMI